MVHLDPLITGHAKIRQVFGEAITLLVCDIAVHSQLRGFIAEHIKDSKRVDPALATIFAAMAQREPQMNIEYIANRAREAYKLLT